MNVTELTPERRDLIETLQAHRALLRRTADGLTDDQAAARPTASQLSVGGILKHVAHTEAAWARFIVDGTFGDRANWSDVDWSAPDPALLEQYASGFRMEPGETLAALLDEYERVAAATDALVATLPDLDVAHPLPAAPWFAPGATRTARRSLMHVVAETAQHAGHADIIRESIDGRKSMG